MSGCRTSNYGVMVNFLFFHKKIKGVERRDQKTVPLTSGKNEETSKERFSISDQKSKYEVNTCLLKCQDSQWVGLPVPGHPSSSKSPPEVVFPQPALTQLTNFKDVFSTTALEKLLKNLKADFTKINLPTTKHSKQQMMPPPTVKKASSEDIESFFRINHIETASQYDADVNDEDEEEEQRATHKKRRKKKSDIKVLPVDGSSCSLIDPSIRPRRNTFKSKSNNLGSLVSQPQNQNIFRQTINSGEEADDEAVDASDVSLGKSQPLTSKTSCKSPFKCTKKDKESK